METTIELNHKLKIERMNKLEEKMCALLEEKHHHCDLTGGVIQAMAKSLARVRICLCSLDLV